MFPDEQSLVAWMREAGVSKCSTHVDFNQQAQYGAMPLPVTMELLPLPAPAPGVMLQSFDAAPTDAEPKSPREPQTDDEAFDAIVASARPAAKKEEAGT